MIRVYFDWTVISDLKQKKESTEPFNSIFNLLSKNKSNLLIPYSVAHLRDLRRGYKDTEISKELTYDDLDFLSQLSENNCLFEDYKTNQTKPIICNPKNYFNDLLENERDYSVDNLFGSTDKKLNDIWKSFAEILKLMPTGIDTKQFESVPENYKSLNNLFTNTKKESSFYNLIKDTMDFITNPNKHTPTYKAMRNYGIDQMKINTDSKQWGNAFDYLDTFLAKSNLNKSFVDIVESSLKNFNQDKEITRYNRFSSYFISLDTFGYYRDKALPNLLDDAMHSYYGAHCDVFVTDDDNTYNKSKAVYDFFKIKTQVIKSEDFLSYFYKLNKIGDFEEDLTERIVEIISHSFVLLDTIDNEKNKVSVHKIDHPLICHFNRMQISYYDYGSVLTFYKKRETYSQFLFWTEVETVINKIVNHFGVDDNLKLEFDNRDKEDLNNEKWKGRIWKRGNIVSKLAYDDEGFDVKFIVSIYNGST